MNIGNKTLCPSPGYLSIDSKKNLIPQADYGEKNSAGKLKTKPFDRSFSALGEISHMLLCLLCVPPLLPREQVQHVWQNCKFRKFKTESIYIFFSHLVSLFVLLPIITIDSILAGSRPSTMELHYQSKSNHLRCTILHCSHFELIMKSSNEVIFMISRKKQLHY